MKKYLSAGLIAMAFAAVAHAQAPSNDPYGEESNRETLATCSQTDKGTNTPVDVTGVVLKDSQPASYLVVQKYHYEGAPRETLFGPIDSREEMDSLLSQVCQPGTLKLAP